MKTSKMISIWKTVCVIWLTVVLLLHLAIFFLDNLGLEEKLAYFSYLIGGVASFIGMFSGILFVPTFIIQVLIIWYFGSSLIKKEGNFITIVPLLFLIFIAFTMFLNTIGGKVILLPY